MNKDRSSLDPTASQHDRIMQTGPRIDVGAFLHNGECGLPVLVEWVAQWIAPSQQPMVSPHGAGVSRPACGWAWLLHAVSGAPSRYASGRWSATPVPSCPQSRRPAGCARRRNAPERCPQRYRQRRKPERHRPPVRQVRRRSSTAARAGTCAALATTSTSSSSYAPARSRRTPPVPR